MTAAVIRYVALYRTPEDVAASDDSYVGSHVPLATSIPGLLRAQIARVLATVSDGPVRHTLAELYFDDSASLQAAFRTDAWAASGADLREWGGLELVSRRIAEVVDDASQPF
ncbi:MAG: EthD family reductase [Mycobacteriales bacterium]